MPTKKGRSRISCSIRPNALAKLYEEMAHYRGDKAPVGAFISQLILKSPENLWQEVRKSMDQVYEDWEDAG